jgi:hypothetical protein
LAGAPSCLRHQACSGACISQEQEKVARRQGRCLCQSGAEGAPGRVLAINSSQRPLTHLSIFAFPSSASIDLAAASLFCPVAITVATERLSSFVYRQSQGAATPCPTCSLLHFSGRSDVNPLHLLYDAAFFTSRPPPTLIVPSDAAEVDNARRGRRPSKHGPHTPAPPSSPWQAGSKGAGRSRYSCPKTTWCTCSRVQHRQWWQ